MSDPLDEFKTIVLKAIGEYGEPSQNKGNKKLPDEFWDFALAIKKMRSAIEDGGKEDIAIAARDLARQSFAVGLVVKWKHHKAGQIDGGNRGAKWHEHARDIIAQGSLAAKPKAFLGSIRELPGAGRVNDETLLKFIRKQLKKHLTT
jgi:hypothetical protein